MPRNPAFYFHSVAFSRGGSINLTEFCADFAKSSLSPSGSACVCVYSYLRAVSLTCVTSAKDRPEGREGGNTWEHTPGCQVAVMGTGTAQPIPRVVVSRLCSSRQVLLTGNTRSQALHPHWSDNVRDDCWGVGARTWSNLCWHSLRL